MPTSTHPPKIFKKLTENGPNSPLSSIGDFPLRRMWGKINLSIGINQNMKRYPGQMRAHMHSCIDLLVRNQTQR